MTTIVARPGLLVADTQYTTPWGCEYRTKIFTVEGSELFSQGLWAAAGDDAVTPFLKSLIRPDSTPVSLANALRNKAGDIDASMLWVSNSYVWYFSTDGDAVEYTDWTAIGSGAGYARAYLTQEDWSGNGGHFALAAMAMRAAVYLDPYTGGDIEERLVK